MGAVAQGEKRAEAAGAGGGEREGAAGAAEAASRDGGLLISIDGCRKILGDVHGGLSPTRVWKMWHSWRMRRRRM